MTEEETLLMAAKFCRVKAEVMEETEAGPEIPGLLLAAVDLEILAEITPERRAELWADLS